jgi:sucrose-6-phosphate hydrolase SacC (GH32 family)
VKYVLKNSLDLRRYDYYTVGTYDRKAERYVPDDPAGDERHLRYDYGNFYASKTFYDPAKKRRVLWGWANESDTRADDVAKGWAGIQVRLDLPRRARVSLPAISSCPSILLVFRSQIITRCRIVDDASVEMLLVVARRSQGRFGSTSAGSR